MNKLFYIKYLNYIYMNNNIIRLMHNNSLMLFDNNIQHKYLYNKLYKNQLDRGCKRRCDSF